MKRIVAIVIVCMFGFILFGCSGSTESPELCDEMVQAGLACQYSGLTEEKGKTILEQCKQNPKGVECALNAYKNSCTSATELLNAMKKCL